MGINKNTKLRLIGIMKDSYEQHMAPQWMMDLVKYTVPAESAEYIEIVEGVLIGKKPGTATLTASIGSISTSITIHISADTFADAHNQLSRIMLDKSLVDLQLGSMIDITEYVEG